MKAKISPTSPKAGNDKLRDISEVYNREMSEIIKPAKNKNQSQVWLLLVVVIVGFFAGVISQLVLMSYGQNFPLLSKLGIFNWGTQILTVTSQKTGTVKTDFTTQFTQVLPQISPSVVSIYAASNQAGDFSGLLTDADRLGTGMAITKDGYLVTLKSIISGNTKLFVTTAQNDTYPVQTIFPDPSSEFVFLKVKNENLTVVPLADLASISQLDQVAALSIDRNVSQNRINLDYIASLSYQPTGTLHDLIYSSDMYNQGIILGGAYTEKESRVIFTEKGEALGIARTNAAITIVTAFSDILPVLDQLSDDKIIRPVFGIRYFDLSNSNSLDTTLTHDLTAGALIISDDEQNYPSVISKSPAQKAGLQKGDIITSVDSQNISSVVKLNSLILSKKPGDTITVEFNRKNIEKEVKITLSTT
jgi:putative serine protease PepD